MKYNVPPHHFEAGSFLPVIIKIAGNNMTVFSFAFIIQTSVYHPVLENLDFEVRNAPSSMSTKIGRCPLGQSVKSRDYYKMLKVVEPKHVK
jgi:hypothetical protein